jgi:hypothetical protein
MDDFYVGYHERAPRRLGRFTGRLVLGLALAAPAVAACVGLAQNALREGRFEFGVRRTYEGVLLEEPLGLLRPEEAPGGLAGVPLLLVGPGKRGLPGFARGHHGRRVRFRGSLIEQGGTRMVEMNDPASFEVLGESAAARREDGPVDLGALTLEGELVDTKCYLGVMRPATGKVHRACAARCLKGGVPPGLLVTGADGGERMLPLAGADGGPAPIDPEWAGRRVRVQGRLTLESGLAVLRASRARLAGD